MEGLYDMQFQGELIDLFRMVVAFVLVLIGFALTDWGTESPKDEDPYDF